MAFVHLHVHSQYSLLDGTIDPGDLGKLAAARGFSAIALTDTANLFGAVAFFKGCKSEKVTPIVGAVLHVQPEGIAYEDPEKERGGYHLIALVEDEVGYQNLCALLTDGIFLGLYYKPRVDLEQLRKRAEGLIFLTGGRRGAFARAVESGRFEEGVAAIRALDFLAPGQLFLELQDLGLPGDDACNDAARRIAAITGRETVVTNAVHYETDEQSATHELLNAIAMGCSLAWEGRVQSPTDQAYLKTEAEIREIFPNDGDAIDRTAAIAARCHFKFTFGQYHFPAATPPDVAPRPADGAAPAAQPDTDANWEYFYRAFPPPRDYGMPDPAVAIPPRPLGAGNIDGYFSWYSERGLELRLERVPAEKHAMYRERLALELGIIAKMGFPAYLLIVAEFINWSKDHGIPVGPGRGSAAGSLVAYAMRITDIDPIEFDLLFERFLNPERVSMPDIDVDFCQDRREEAIHHVRQKYGEELVSQIITYGKLKAKAAVRDVARVLDLSFTDADAIAKQIPDDLDATIKGALDRDGGGVDQLIAMHDGDPKVRRVLSLARAVEGKARQTGVHAAGVVIADRPLVNYAPLYRDEVGAVPAVQYDMKSAETIGLIKFDFLGLKTLDQIRDTVVAIERNHGVKVDIGRIPVDDVPSYQLLSAGDALGVFQLESSGMRELLSRLKPNCLDDLVALVALYRPGPLSSGMVDDFVNRKHGLKEVVYPLPMLEPILRPTYGTIVYQEQVMQCAQVMAGYSLGEADLLRRAMGKKDAKEMAKQKSRFVGGSVQNGIDEGKASEIFDLLEKFAAYGFNKSHSAAYGYISYQTAWLKANYRAEYMAALLTIDAGNTDKLIAYFDDCRVAGIRIDPVSVNESLRAFDAPKRAPGTPASIRFGMAGVKGVGEGAIEAILEARSKTSGKRFKDAFDFFDKVDHRRINKKVIESLIKAGALDFGKVPRRALMEGMESAVSLAQKRQDDEQAGQTSLFGGMTTRGPSFKWPDVPEWPLSERLANEKEALGFYVSGHPMQSHAKDVAKYAKGLTIAAHKGAAKAPEGELVIVGIPGDVRVVKTRRGDRMAIVKMEDETGWIEAVFFPEAWTRSQRAVQALKPMVVRGSAQGAGAELSLRANTAELLAEIRIRETTAVQFVLDTRELEGDRLERFLAVLKQWKGNCPTRLLLKNPGRFEVEVDLPNYPVEPGTELDEAVQTLFGRADAVVL